MGEDKKALVETPESLVRKSERKERLYHGSKGDFDKFTKKGIGKHGLGFYFTPDKSEAHHYAHTLAGDGSSGMPTIYHADVELKKPFNTMNAEHARAVAKHHGMEYRVPKSAGGAREHYHHLEAQMKRAGKIQGPAGRSNFNEKIKEAGFDHIHYDLMGHKIALDPSQIKIKRKELAKSEHLFKAEAMDQNMLYITIDGDGIGRKVGRTVLADDEEGLKEISNIINGAQDFMAHQIEQMGGEVIERGGDETTGKIPAEALEQVETMRQDVQNSFGFTITVGVGRRLSEASKALLVGKTQGKDQIVIYGPEIDAQMKEISERVESGDGSPEDQKIADAYLDDGQGAPDESQEQGDDDCEYCDDADDEADDEPQGDNPDEVGNDEADQDQDQDDDDDDDSDNDEDDCDYCQDADSADQNAEEDDDASDTQDDMPSEDDDDQEDGSDPDEHSEEGMKQIAEAIEDDEAGPGEIDDADMPVGDDMEDGVSHPDDYDDAGDHSMGLSEEEADEDQGPDLGSVLKDGLDSHADSIQKEKVGQLVGQALEGFKENKKILEMAKEQAPEFYQASIMMLKAMIEMAKMLGLSQDDGGGESEGEIESDEQQPTVPTAPTDDEESPQDPKQ